MVALLSRALAKLDSMPETAHCDPHCPGWNLVNTDTEPEIQACDACWQQLEAHRRLTDSEAASLPVARRALREARTQIAERREEAVRRRRTAVVTAAGLRSPCCDQPLIVWTTTRGDHVARDHACGACSRPLQLPPTVEEISQLHLLHHGSAICGRMTGEPASWPDGHQWIGVNDAVTNGIHAGAPPLCVGCHTELIARAEAFGVAR